MIDYDSLFSDSSVPAAPAAPAPVVEPAPVEETEENELEKEALLAEEEPEEIDEAAEAEARKTLEKLGIIGQPSNSTEKIEQVTIEQVARVLPEMFDGEDLCHHLCECGKWWTHGDKNKCRYPDLLNQGKCPDCLGGEKSQFDPAKEIELGKNGEVKLTAAAAIKVANDQRERCKNMSVEQLTYHISFLATEIEKLRQGMMTSRKMRAELEEIESAHLPEAEKQKFIEALRNSSTGAKADKKVKVAKPKKLSKEAQLTAAVEILKGRNPGLPMDSIRSMASMMVTLNKTAEQVEAFLND